MKEKGLKVLEYLKSYIHSRGIPRADLPWSLRHHKTVLYTSKFSVFQDEAELIVVKENSAGYCASDDMDNTDNNEALGADATDDI